MDLSRQKQKFRHKPEDGILGDCSRTVIACLLRIPRDDVPHEHTDKADAFFKREKAFLASRGMWRIAIPLMGDLPLEDAINIGANWADGREFILQGKSKNGTNHVVIADRSGIVWDPAIDDSGIVSCSSDGFWWVEFIVGEIGISVKTPNALGEFGACPCGDNDGNWCSLPACPYERKRHQDSQEVAA